MKPGRRTHWSSLSIAYGTQIILLRSVSMAINYGKKFDIDLKYGQESEELIKSVFGGEVKVEVKRDDKWPLRTGNVFVEVEYLGEPSGIETTEAEYWIHFWRPGRAFIMETKELKKL